MKILKKNNENLIFEFDGIKTINKILKNVNDKFKKKKKELEKELEKSEEYINIDSRIKDKKQKDINELTILKDMHEKEIKNLKDQLILKKSDQELKSRKRADHQGKGYVDLPIFLSKLNINSSKELINNIKQLINDLYDNEQITKQVYNNIIKAITYKNDW